MKRVLVLTDSLSLPRKHVDGVVLWEDCYVERLKKEFPAMEFILVAMGGATITDLNSQLNYYSLLQPDLVILQCGIVDCAPRALGRLELEVVKRLRIFRLVKPFFKIFRKYRGLTYTPIKTFHKTLKLIKHRFPDSPLWAIGILPGCEAYDQKVPGVSRNIKQYNAILKQETHFIDQSDFPQSGIIDDYHHMNAEGHLHLFDQLRKALVLWDKKAASVIN